LVESSAYLLADNPAQAVNMLHWLHSLLPHIPHYGYVLVFIVAFLNNLGLPLPGETILLGAGFVLGKTADSLWQPVVAGTAACFLGGICAFWLGRRLGRGSLEKIRWLHLTPQRMKWPEQFFKRHGAKTVFIARFIFLFPPVVVNLLAYAASYVLIGYLFGKQWKLLEAWLGPVALYLILAGLVIVALGVIFRHSVSGYWVRIFPKERRGK
jgi:membrane protein DedA with SNARE-associated domain